MAQRRVRSADGTSIVSHRWGEGRPLLLVSGALSTSEMWKRVLPLLQEGRSVEAIDRRGRGPSGNEGSYAPEREVEDILAVIAAHDEPLDLLGHSSGAILSLQVAARVPQNLARLVVYEPPVFFTEADRIALDLPERLDALLASARREEAIDLFLREGPRQSEADLVAMKAGPGWPNTLNLAHTVPYDARVQRSFSAAPEELESIRIPTLVLVGGDSPQRMRSGSEAVAARLPRAALRELTGQRHTAMLGAPASFATAVNDFLAAPSGLA
jgi:pimeloyl-ACP methyl ester carboxylesterase